MASQCSPGTYFNGSTCAGCSPPGAGTYVKRKCTTTHDTVTSNKLCGFGYYGSITSQGNWNTLGTVSCTQCPEPSASQYVTAVCTSTTPTAIASKTNASSFSGSSSVLGDPSVPVSGVCPVGYYCINGVSSTTPCPPGHYCPSQAISPLPCPAGAYCPAGSSVPTTCTPGNYCPPLSSQQTSCSAGFYCPGGSANQIPCEPYTYSTTGQASCTCSGSPVVQDGVVVNNSGVCSVTCNQSFTEYRGSCFSQMRPLITVYYAPDGTMSSNQVAGSRVGYTCPPCYTMTGIFCTFNNTCDNTCPPGYALNDDNMCSLCPTGQYVLNDTCVPSLAGSAAYNGLEYLCPEGTYSIAGQSSCSVCPIGTYSSSIGAVSVASCLPCPAGTYGDVTGLTTCKICPRGKYSTATGQSSPSTCQNCSTCPLGQYSVSSCLSYQDRTGACITCPVGEYCDGISNVSCSSGFYCPVGSGSQQRCTQGYSGPRASSCSTCPAGSFVDSQNTSCSFCPPGTFSATSNVTTCSLCPLGKYWDSADVLVWDVLNAQSIQQSELEIGSGSITFNNTPYLPLRVAYAMSFDVYIESTPTNNRNILENTNLGTDNSSTSRRPLVYVTGTSSRTTGPNKICVEHWKRDNTRFSVCSTSPIEIKQYTRVVFNVSDVSIEIFMNALRDAVVIL